MEIIGNVNEPAKILAHLGKMFAAITTLDCTAGGASGSSGVSEGSGVSESVGVSTSIP